MLGSSRDSWPSLCAVKCCYRVEVSCRCSEVRFRRLEAKPNYNALDYIVRLAKDS